MSQRFSSRFTFKTTNTPIYVAKLARQRLGTNCGDLPPAKMQPKVRMHEEAVHALLPFHLPPAGFHTFRDPLIYQI